MKTYPFAAPPLPTPASQPSTGKIPRSARTFRPGLLFLCALSLCAAPAAAPAPVEAHRGQIELPTYPWWPAVRHPYFRGTDGNNIYPYSMLDNLSRRKENRSWQTVVIENEFLRVTFLPQLGGRIYEVLDKTSGQPMFYVNHVLKPGLIGQCGAWISGGVEFNSGPAGHTVSAVTPVDVQILPPAPDGSRSVAVGEVERVYRTRWTVVVTLHPGRCLLDQSVRIYNLTDSVRPYYFWNCTAVPNPSTFRFIYPMTLGSDHAGTTFFKWPIDQGKDLSLGRTYQDASSIFAYQCDQDFFGSYDDGADRGVVAFADHHELPGKKAWTWGHGSYGTMHQMDLTDNDGPYNEVQTGPMNTQAEVGRLDPLEAVVWQEAWYPIHGIGGFTYANRDLAVNASVETNHLRMRLMGTADWEPVYVRVLKERRTLTRTQCKVSPLRPTEVTVDVTGFAEPFEVELSTFQKVLAHFRLPLELPVRQPPAKRSSPRTAAEFARAGWDDYLFARIPEAETHFRRGLEQDANNTDARVGLAYLDLERDPAKAVTTVHEALASDPDAGAAQLVLAAAEARQGHWREALEAAWRAALDPAAVVPARALIARISLHQGSFESAARVLAEPGPWQADPVCRNRLAYASHKLGDDKIAANLAEQSLRDDPLDAFARSILWLARAEVKTRSLADLIEGQAQGVVDLAAQYADLGQETVALSLLNEFYFRHTKAQSQEPIPCYWAAYLSARLEGQDNRKDSAKYLRRASELPAEGVFPHRAETVPVLRWALQANPNDGKAALYLGHLLFSLGRYAEGREFWEQAARLNVEPAVAYRALGMACQRLDHDAAGAKRFLEQANHADPADPIVARDLARTLFTFADQAQSAEDKRSLATQVAGILNGAFNGGKGRSDFVALLARAHNRLGEFAETARLLDSVRITIWEGAREAHDLFEEAHLALGRAELEAGRATEALAEFNRALEYPENLATGKLENTPEAHIHYWRGNALAALGQKTAALEAWRKAADETGGNQAQANEARPLARTALEKAAREAR